MPVRVTMSLSQELTLALDAVAEAHGESRSSMAEILLREATQIRTAIRDARGNRTDPAPDPAPLERVGTHFRRVYS